jgi:membrane-associated phospholipid phosphatase
MLDSVHTLITWHLIARLGEAGIVLPIALALGLWLVISAGSMRLASSWLMPLFLAAGVTTLSKLAFIGWGIGIASLDFTGFSGHAMFGAAIYPMLAYALTHRARGRMGTTGHVLALLAGYALAALIAVSRVKTGAHSVSEAAAGFLLGAAASGCALWLTERVPHRLPGRWVYVGIAAWLTAMPAQASPSQTHGMVIQLALTLSHRSVPYVRADLHRTAKRTASSTEP